MTYLGMRIIAPALIRVDDDHPIIIERGDYAEFDAEQPDGDAIVPSLLGMQNGRYVPIILEPGVTYVLKAKR